MLSLYTFIHFLQVKGTYSFEWDAPVPGKCVSGYDSFDTKKKRRKGILPSKRNWCPDWFTDDSPFQPRPLHSVISSLSWAFGYWGTGLAIFRAAASLRSCILFRRDVKGMPDEKECPNAAQLLVMEDAMKTTPGTKEITWLPKQGYPYPSPDSQC